MANTCSELGTKNQHIKIDVLHKQESIGLRANGLVLPMSGQESIIIVQFQDEAHDFAVRACEEHETDNKRYVLLVIVELRFEECEYLHDRESTTLRHRELALPLGITDWQ